MNRIRQQEDGTLSRNNKKYLKFLISEYQLIKAKKHVLFKFCSNFYKHHNLKKQNFLKYYNRYINTKDDLVLRPQKRGPRFFVRRTPPEIEKRVIELRLGGVNRYEIAQDLRFELGDKAPAPTTVYAILRRHNLNKLKPKMNMLTHRTRTVRAVMVVIAL